MTAPFVPTAFVPVVAGQCYAQFAVTISVATIISTVSALGPSPAITAILMTAFAFTLGVVPQMIAAGPRAEMPMAGGGRQSFSICLGGDFLASS